MALGHHMSFVLAIVGTVAVANAAGVGISGRIPGADITVGFGRQRTVDWELRRAFWLCGPSTLQHTERA